MEPANTLRSQSEKSQEVSSSPASSPLPTPTAPLRTQSSPVVSAAQTPMTIKHICVPVKTSYKTPTICSVCRMLLFGFTNQGYYCAGCKKNYHKACLPSCNISHRCQLVLMTYMTPTSCTLCSRMLTGVRNQGYHCQICGDNYHAYCRPPNSTTNQPTPSQRSETMKGGKHACAQCRWIGRGHQCAMCKQFICKNCMPRKLHAPADAQAILALEEKSSGARKCRVCDDCMRKTFTPAEAVHGRTAVASADEQTPTPVHWIT